MARSMALPRRQNFAKGFQQRFGAQLLRIDELLLDARQPFLEHVATVIERQPSEPALSQITLLAERSLKLI